MGCILPVRLKRESRTLDMMAAPLQCSHILKASFGKMHPGGVVGLRITLPTWKQPEEHSFSTCPPEPQDFTWDPMRRGVFIHPSMCPQIPTTWEALAQLISFRVLSEKAALRDNFTTDIAVLEVQLG